MPLNAGQQLVVDSPARFRVVIAGRRWGKSFLAIRETARVARYPDQRVFLVYPTYRQAKQVIWEPLKYRLQDLNWVARVNESDLTINLRNGSRISLRGADNPDSLRGVGLSALIMDEFSQIDPRTWSEVLRPTLSDTGGSAMFISTPMGTANWAYDLYNRGQDPTETAWASWSFRTVDGGNVSEGEIEQARRDLDLRTFQQEYLATFESYQNRIYYAFDPSVNIRRWDRPLPDTLAVGLDFNVGQMSAAVFAREGDVIHAVDEIALYSSNTTEMAQEISARYGRRKIFVYPDPSGSARKSSASGSTDHTILANAGFVVKSPHSHNPVRDGINAVNTKLCNARGEPTMFVDPGCKKMIESLEKHTYKENSNNVPDKDSGHDHFSDSIRYFVDYVFPIRRDMVHQTPTRWGHRI